uniref:Uncharacterized protein n=1 Tax=Rhizophora mucronata TaxID=61149 RepID=A0A2P2PNN3_RHIMU
MDFKRSKALAKKTLNQLLLFWTQFSKRRIMI